MAEPATLVEHESTEDEDEQAVQAPFYKKYPTVQLIGEGTVQVADPVEHGIHNP